jgi:hypothetical protein
MNINKAVKYWQYHLKVKTNSFYKEEKIFCLSFQKTATTSVGKFFKLHNYDVATEIVCSRNKWSLKWFKGDFDSIFKSYDFINNQVFEDSPWWFSDFYKYLFHKFPNSKFILFERNSDDWFDSMMKFKKGGTLGNTHLHTYLYGREGEFYELPNFKDSVYSGTKDSLLKIEESNRVHYISKYENRNRQIKEFFKNYDNSRLFYTTLEDSSKWQKMADFFNFQVDANFNVHENKTL